MKYTFRLQFRRYFLFSRCAALFLTSLKYEILRSDNPFFLFLYSAIPSISFVPYTLLKMLSKHLKHIISLAEYAPTPKDGDASEIDRHWIVLSTLNSLKDATLLPSCDTYTLQFGYPWDRTGMKKKLKK